MALTPKQARFVQEYLVDLNATAAAKRAGYSAKNADKIGSELLGKTRVSDAIQAAVKQREQRTAYSIGQRLLKNVEIQKALQDDLDAQTRRELGFRDMVTCARSAKIAQWAGDLFPGPVLAYSTLNEIVCPGFSRISRAFRSSTIMWLSSAACTTSTSFLPSR